MTLVIPCPPIGPPNRIIRDGSLVTRYDWKSEAQKKAWPSMVDRELESIERYTWGGRWRRFVALFAGMEAR